MTDSKKALYAPLATSEDAPPPSYAASAAPGEFPPLASSIGSNSSQQPTAMPQMAIGGSRNPKSMAIGSDGKRSWNHSLCSCYEAPGLTLASACCPCFVYSSNRSRLNHLTETGQANPSPQRIGLWCCLYSLSPQLAGVGQLALQCFARLQTRSRYGIRGNVVEDVLVGAFCAPCSLVQESREISDEELALREGGPPPETFYRDEEQQVEAEGGVAQV